MEPSPISAVDQLDEEFDRLLFGISLPDAREAREIARYADQMDTYFKILCTPTLEDGMYRFARIAKSTQCCIRKNPDERDIVVFRDGFVHVYKVTYDVRTGNVREMVA
eukprot:841511_1